MAKKYQVFISSTFDDLKEHRDAVVKAVLQLGHLPVGMEMFNAGDQTQWETIKTYIDSSDYYLVILAHRYGSKDPASGLSYTEKEYDYAGEQGVPRLGFVIDKTATWPADRVEAKAKKKLDDFKRKVGSARVIKFWDTTDKLAYHISLSLGNEITINPRVGWVRATEAASPQVAEELARLSKENKELSGKLSALENYDELSSINDIIAHEFCIVTVDSEEREVSFKELFMIASLNQEKPHTLNIYQILLKQLEARQNNDFRPIRVGLEEMAKLGLFDVTRSQNGTDIAYWNLTEKGKKLYTKIRYSI
ncbi:MAG: DUF4062 domain-containing protein [Janthinobacterium lividum]